MKEYRQRFLLAVLAAPANGSHLQPGKLPYLQACRLALQAFSEAWQSVDFVNILRRPIASGACALTINDYLTVLYAIIPRGI